MLLTRDGYGHTSYGFSTCVQHAVNAYLVEPDPPGGGDDLCELIGDTPQLG